MCANLVVNGYTNVHAYHAALSYRKEELKQSGSVQQVRRQWGGRSGASWPDCTLLPGFPRWLPSRSDLCTWLGPGRAAPPAATQHQHMPAHTLLCMAAVDQPGSQCHQRSS
jgi:hypothetical protein